MDSRGNPYTISRPVELAGDPLFRTDRAHAALVLNPAVNNYVRTVDNTSPWESAAELGAAMTFGGAPGALGVAVNGAVVRSVLRPAGQGAGRSRWR